jgi:hypothetical protein
MELIPARILRRAAMACPSAPQLTARQRQTRAYILEAATNIFADQATPHIPLKSFADACGLAQSIVRRHVCDMYYLFRLVLTAHLDMLLAAIGAIPNTMPNRQARCRAEYRRLTQDHAGNLTPIHALLVRHRAALPPDQLEPVEAQRRMIGGILAGEDWAIALDLLDGPAELDRLEAMLAAPPLARPARAHAAQPDLLAPIRRRPLLPVLPEIAPSAAIIAAGQTAQPPSDRHAA